MVARARRTRENIGFVRYVLELRVSHANVDFVGEQKLADLLGMFEQAAVEASQACGWDPRAYAAAQRVWMIRRTRVWRWAAVGGLDQLRVETQVADVRRARSLREYRVWSGSVLVAEAATDWVYCDVQRGRPVRIPEELAAALHGGGAVPHCERAPHPFETPAESPEIETVTVQPSHLDHVQHVNNATYVDFLDNAALSWCGRQGWPLARMLAEGGALRPVGVDVEYLDDAGVGEFLEVATWGRWERDEEGPPRAALFWQVIRRPSGSTLLRAFAHYRWRQRSPVLGAPPS